LASSALKDVLKREPPLPPYSTSPAFNFYRFLLETEYSSSRAVMKAQAGAALLPERHGIFASPVNVSAENLSLLESVQPN